MPSLTCTYRPEDEWHGEITAAVDSNGYIGQGSAWFSIDELRAFGAALNAYPITAGQPVLLQGGHWKDKQAGEKDEIDELHVGISVIPYDAVGGLVVTVRLARPVLQMHDRNLDHSLVAQLKTDYAYLANFCASYLALIEGRAQVAVLHGQ